MCTLGRAYGDYGCHGKHCESARESRIEGLLLVLHKEGGKE